MQGRAMAHISAPGLASPVWLRLEALRQMHKERTPDIFAARLLFAGILSRYELGPAG
jgi:hypothetical protein